ncbi:MAG: hypothetical protein SGJ21_06835 [Alphaproteobacteria bacterium]|nr:hypothetical protein [Alphaproteobacteria bacterium]
MKRPRPHLRMAIGLMLAGAGVVPAASSWADRPLSLSFREQPGFARITAKWADGDQEAPRISASVSDQVLVLRFDQKVTVDLNAMKEGLPSWAALTRMDPDGMTARVGLTQTPRLQISMSADLTAVDLVPEAITVNPPAIVSPLIARRVSEAAAARVAAIPPPAGIEDLEVRGSQAGDSSRVAFYWPRPVAYKEVARGPGLLKLLFARRAKADLAYMHISPPANVADFQAENTDKGYLVTITSKDDLPIKHFLDGDVTVIDISKPAPEPEPDEDDDAGSRAGSAAKPPPSPAKAEPPAPVVETPAAVESKGVAPSVGRRTPEAGKPMLLAPPRGVIEDEAPGETAVAEAAASDAILGGAERRTELASFWRDPAPPSGVVDVKVSPLASGVQLQAMFSAPTPAAVFSRGNAVWVVFAANADLKVDTAALPTGFRVRTLRGQNATMMRIEAPKGLNVSADAIDAAWTIRFAATATKPQRFLKTERRADGGGRARIETMMVGAAGLVWFEDPLIGDQIAAAVAYGPSSASTTPRDFVEASLPATAHGLAIAPKADNVVVTVEGEKVVVSMPGRSQSVEENANDGNEAAATSVNPAFIDFAGWGGKSGAKWYDRRRELEAATTLSDLATPEGAAAMMDLARFYIGHEMALETLGVLKLAGSERSDLELDAEYLGMRGAANVMAHRMKAGEADLSRGPLRADASAALWRGVVAVDKEEWENAADFFRLAEDQIFAYPPAWAARFSAAAAEAALNTNDYDGARRLAEQAVATGQGVDIERAKLVLANLKAAVESPAAAYADFETLARKASEPVAVLAELKRLEYGVPVGKVTANDAAAGLEVLRFRWRGDGVELATVGILSDQYMQVGRFREALLLAQSAALREPGAPGARDLRIKLTEYFRRLFLDGAVDRLDPIQALALFYEFADLTPIGTDGDQMIRKLAQRLVAFDLLEPAANLLQHQVDNRMRGVGKSAIAVDLAIVYLMDKRPDRALAAINGSRQPALPKELALERRLLEAAAYRDLGRYDHVVELVEGLEGAEARSLLADAYWRDRKWAEAGRVLRGMLPPPREAIKPEQADIAMRAAIAARMAKDGVLLAELRAGYAPLFEGNPNKASFDLITSQTDVAGAALSEAVKRLGDAPRVDALATAMRTRFEGAKAIPDAGEAGSAPEAARTEAPTPKAPAGG